MVHLGTQAPPLADVDGLDGAVMVPSPDGVGTQATVAILLGACNGAAHLQAQLDSLAAQTLTDWVLVVSDDASSDATLALLTQFRVRMGAARVHVRRGPGRGFLANFLSLASNPGVRAQYYAFCDQDDVWDADKLERAVARLAACGEGPALYGSRTRLIDERGAAIGYSPLFSRPPAFRNALVQSIAGANTMVFNEAARQWLARAGADVDVASHDWWLYLLVSGVGGTVIYDPVPTMAYRQHDGNLVGRNRGLRARLDRLSRLLSGVLAQWNGMHAAALQRIESDLTPENRQLYQGFLSLRRAGLWGRLGLLSQTRLHRQSWFDNLGLLVSVLLARF